MIGTAGPSIGVSTRGRNPLARRAALPDWLRGARRTHVRVGSSICAQLLPDAAGLKRSIGFARDEGLGLEMATPVVGDDSLSKVQELLLQLAEDAPEAEIVANDWGVLRVLIRRGRSLRITAGRLLHRQMRDPRIASLTPRDLGSEKWPEAWCLGSASSPRWNELMASCGVTRIEADWTSQGLGMGPPARLELSLHLPMSLVALGRTCILNGPTGPAEGFGAQVACARTCVGAAQVELEMRVDGRALDLVRAGRAEWVRHEPAELNRARRWLESAPRVARVIVAGWEG